jgi:ribosomal protein S18 acetylase RimI-like enzyme
MKISFKQIRRSDFEHVRGLALKGWYFSYKHLKEEDLKALVEEYYSDESLEKQLNTVETGNQSFVLAFDKDKLVGFCSIVLKGKKGELLGLYIEPDLIGKGLGKRLLATGEDYLKSKSVSDYFTFVNKHNKLGIDFYLKNGFKHKPKKDKDDEFEPKVLMCMEKHITF